MFSGVLAMWVRVIVSTILVLLPASALAQTAKRVPRDRCPDSAAQRQGSHNKAAISASMRGIRLDLQVPAFQQGPELGKNLPWWKLSRSWLCSPRPSGRHADSSGFSHAFRRLSGASTN